MKTLGIVGGIAPESTIAYYRAIISRYRAQLGDNSYPALFISSIDLTKMLGMVADNDLVNLVEYLLEEITRLQRAGAVVAALASNTPHIVFDELRSRSPLPLISIVESACEVAKKRGLHRLGLFGTRFTMQSGFYGRVFSKEGIDLLVPDSDEQDYIHESYVTELVNGIFRQETRDHLLAIARRMKDRDGIDGLILGGTELPLILAESEYDGLPLLDTTQIHVRKIVQEMLS